MTGPSNPEEQSDAAPPDSPVPLDLEKVRERLRQRRGPAYWRSLRELAGDERFRELLEKEMPRHASAWDESGTDGFSRRRFLELGMASLALGGLAACTRQPLERIVPYVKQPEEILPGVPLFYATAIPFGGFGAGLLAESHEGRPTKVEGNPDHPASLGGASAIAQASILTLYDPDRSQTVTRLGDVETWARFVEELSLAAKAQRALGGSGLRILTRTVTSPTLAAQMKAFEKIFPKARWHQWEPVGRDAVRAGSRLAYGQSVETRYDLSRADVVVSLDADFLVSGPFAVRYSKDFMARRRPQGAPADMSRLYAAEVSPTPTGTVADHRVPVRASALPQLAAALAAEAGASGFAKPSGLDAKLTAWVSACAKDLKAHAGRSAVIPGEYATPAVHAAAAAVNAALGNLGKTVLSTEPVEPNPVDQLASIRELAEAIQQKKVDVLLVLGGNPVYDAPADLEFGKRLLTVPFRVHLGLYEDETAAYCPWHVPEAHYLEAWSDVRALDGTTTIVQPLIEPLYEGKSIHEILSVLLDDSPRKGHDIVKESWRAQRPGPDFEPFWRKALHDGVVPGTALPHKTFALDAAGIRLAAAELVAPPKAGALELVFRPDPSLFDGSLANNGWLQELPKPLSKLTWDNAAVLSPATAEKLHVSSDDVVEVKTGRARLTLSAMIQPGQAPDVVTVHLGFGRTRAGRVGNGVGVDTYRLRMSDAPWLVSSIELRKTGETQLLSHTQEHFRMEGRELVRSASLAEYRKDPAFAKKAGELPKPDASLYRPAFEYKEYAWGLSVDLSSCTGCNACVIACQAENNIPIVGKEQVRRNREMHWIRIDQYYEGKDIDTPEVHHQPVMCQQCENAPCEVVCPVAATTHSAEGLNDMVYNRCVGTRYCSNNCPYKVRRFNFFEYNGDQTPVLKMVHNPDVTVRSRGVMEKCTYCVQRINRARIAAELEGRGIRDGEIRTACQQSCPADAIVFGNINDPSSAVARSKADTRTYWLLDELNTRPRTSYMAKVRNPNPEMEG